MDLKASPPLLPDEDWWLRRKHLRSSGPFMFRDYRTRPPTTMNSILAMLAEIYRLYPQPPRRFWPAYSVLRGFARSVKLGCESLMRFGPAARDQFGRSYRSQALDMARAWWETGLPPPEYYDGLLARHGGGPAIFNYLYLQFFHPVLVELQFGLFGRPTVQINDKGRFGDWRKSCGLPGPQEVSLHSDSPRLAEQDLSALGDQIIIKPRASGQGDRIKAWTRQGDRWIADRGSLTTPDFMERLYRWAGRELRGLVIQERVFNHERIAGLCGETLSTCRIVTLRNEQNELEVVKFYWRMATRSGVVVDNFHAGGVVWMAKDYHRGAIDHGVTKDQAVRQEVATKHPATGKVMVGSCHPFWPEMRALALRAHSLLPDLLLVGWDIAATPSGPMLIEANSPEGAATSSFLAFDGFANCRYGEILAWHARNWIEGHVAKDSRRRISQPAPR